MLTLAVGRITRAGYLYIGMDHFAQPDDELAVAQRQGRLQRSLEGYSTRPESDLLGVGIAAIGRVGPTYYQNLRDLNAYYGALDDGRPPIWRGIDLTQDDLLRRAVIEALSCHFRVSIESLEVAYLIDFRRYFAAELEALKPLVDDGLVGARARLDRGDLERPAARARGLHGVRPISAHPPRACEPFESDLMQSLQPGLWTLPAAMLVAGFVSGVHCLGMCGGVVSAFAARVWQSELRPGSQPEWPRQLAFNAGRISSYGAAGALVGRDAAAVAYRGRCALGLAALRARLRRTCGRCRRGQRRSRRARDACVRSRDVTKSPCGGSRRGAPAGARSVPPGASGRRIDRARLRPPRARARERPRRHRHARAALPFSEAPARPPRTAPPTINPIAASVTGPNDPSPAATSSRVDASGAR